MKSPIVFAVAAVFISTAAVAGPCSEDKKKFCADVLDAKGDWIACLTQHKDQLSEPCKAKVEKGWSKEEHPPQEK
jgi:hypothetical protein